MVDMASSLTRWGRRIGVPLFWFTVGLVYVLAIMPSAEAPDLGAGDKVNHVAAFMTLTWLGRVAYGPRSSWQLPVLLSLFGALIEITQALPVVHRDASFWDWAADTLAIATVLPFTIAIERRIGQQAIV